MRFKATLVDVDCIATLSSNSHATLYQTELSNFEMVGKCIRFDTKTAKAKFMKIVAAINKLSKSCVIRLTSSKLYFIVTENQLHGGVSLWCELPQSNFCSGYEFVGHGDRNEIYLEISVDSFYHSLKSALNCKVLRIKLTQKATACLTLDVVLPSMSLRNRTVTHDIPLRIIPSRLWDEYKEPDIPEFDVSFYLPALRTLKNVVERLKNLSTALSLSANKSGDMVLKVKSELATVGVSFKDLLQASWKDTSVSNSQRTASQASQALQSTQKTQFYKVTIDIKRLHALLSGLQLPTDKVVCNVVEDTVLQIFFIYDQLSIQYSIPAQNLV